MIGKRSITIFTLGFILVFWVGPLATAASIEWADSLKSAQKLAQMNHKLVFIDVYADWCGWCKRLESEVFTQESVASVLKENYIPVRINSDKDPEFSAQYEIEGLPTMIVLSSEGIEIGRIDGFMQAEQLRTSLLHIQQSETLISALKDKLKKNPNDLVSLYKLGTLAWNFRRFEETVRYLGQAVAKDPQSVVVDREQALMPLAKSYGLIGDPTGGVQFVQQFMAEFPQSEQIPEAHFVLGLMLMEQEKLEAAKVELEKLLALPPDKVPEVFRSRAEMLLQQIGLR